MPNNRVHTTSSISAAAPIPAYANKSDHGGRRTGSGCWSMVSSIKCRDNNHAHSASNKPVRATHHSDSRQPSAGSSNNGNTAPAAPPMALIPYIEASEMCSEAAARSANGNAIPIASAAGNSINSTAAPCKDCQPDKDRLLPRLSKKPSSHGINNGKVSAYKAMPPSSKASKASAARADLPKPRPVNTKLPTPSPAINAVTVNTTPKILMPNINDSIRVHNTSYASAVTPVAPYKASSAHTSLREFINSCLTLIRKILHYRSAKAQGKVKK